jgi:hypothetical protein
MGSTDNPVESAFFRPEKNPDFRDFRGFRAFPNVKLGLSDLFRPKIGTFRVFPGSFPPPIFCLVNFRAAFLQSQGRLL